MRSPTHTLMAILHLTMAVLYLPWIAMHALVLLAVGQVGALGAGGAVLALSLALHILAVLGLGVAAVGLLRQVPWGRIASLLYAVPAMGAALLLWMTGARAWFVALLLLYPLVVLVVFGGRRGHPEARPPGDLRE